MIYHIDYIENNDVDWFCIINGLPCHLSSNGGRLHPLVESNRDYNRSIQIRVAEMNDLNIGNPYINEEFVGTIVSGVIERHRDLREIFTVEVYSKYFLEIARKGFFSYDNRLNLQNGQYEYKLIAGPCSIEEYKNRVKQEQNIYPPFINSLIRFQTDEEDMSTIAVDKLIFVE